MSNNRIRRSGLAAICGIGLALLLNGCIAKQRGGTGSYLNPTKHISTHIENHPALESLQANIKIKFEVGGVSFSSRGRLKRDNTGVTQLSITPFLGIEAYQLTVTDYEVLLIDRTSRRYFLSSIRELSQQLGVDISGEWLLNLFSNQVLFYEEVATMAPRRWYEDIQRGSDKIEYLYRSKALTHSYTIDTEEERLTETSIAMGDNLPMITISYDDFTTIEDHLFAQELVASFDIDNHVATTELDMSRITINEEIECSYKIPTRYNRVTLSEIVSLFKHTSRQ